MTTHYEIRRDNKSKLICCRECAEPMQSVFCASIRHTCAECGGHSLSESFEESRERLARQYAERQAQIRAEAKAERIAKRNAKKPT